MKNRIVALSVCFAVAAAFGMTRILAAQESQLPKFEEVSLTGCLVQGSGPSVFILENARTDPRDTSQKGRSYVLADGSMSISFRDHLNNEVRVDGEAEMKTPPAMPVGQRAKESDLPKLKATKVTHIATTCSAPVS